MNQRFLRPTTLGGLLGLATLAACSLANSVPEPSAGPGTGGEGGTTSTGGDGGTTVTGGGGSGAGGGGQAECGNGTVETGEDCDAQGESATCDEDCSAVECGDGIINRTAGERCDDGNTAPGDACDPSCQPSTIQLSDPAPILFPPFANVVQPSVLVVSDAQGDETILATYSTINAAGDDFVIGARRLDLTGSTLGSVFELGGGIPATPAAAQNDNGDVMIIWSDLDPGTGVNYAMLAPDFTLTGIGGVITGSDGTFLNPVVHPRPSPSDGFCVQWFDAINDRVENTCFDGTGTNPGGVNGYAAADPGVDGRLLGPMALLPFQGGFLSLYWSSSQELRVQLLNANGSLVGSNFFVGTSPGMSSWVSGVAATGGTAFTVAYAGDFTGNGIELQLQPMLNQSTPDGPPVALTTDPVQSVGYDLISHGGRYALLYGETPIGTNIFDGCSMHLQEIDAAGQKIGDRLELAPFVTGACPVFADADVTSDGDVVVTWVVNNSSTGNFINELIIFPGVLASP